MIHEPYTISWPKEKEIKILKGHKPTTNSLRNNIPVNKTTQITKKTTPSFSAFNLDRLNLQPKLYIEVAEKLGILSKHDNFNAKVLEYYNCLPNKINLDLTEDTQISEVLVAITNEVKRMIHPKSEWKLLHEGDDKVSIVEYLEVSCNQEGACIPVGFLPDIKKKDIKAHDALIKLFQFIYQKTKVNFVGHDDEWGFFENVKEQLSDLEDKEEFSITQQSILSYTKGECLAYYRLIKKQKHVVLSNELNFDTPIPELTNWIHKLRRLLDEEYYPVHKFDFDYLDPYNEDGYSLMFSQYIGFYWKNDFVFKEFDEIYNQTAQQIGQVNPSWTKVYHDGLQNGEIKDSLWPAKFHDLMSKFNVSVLPKILEYYDIDKKDY